MIMITAFEKKLDYVYDYDYRRSCNWLQSIMITNYDYVIMITWLWLPNYKFAFLYDPISLLFERAWKWEKTGDGEVIIDKEYC